MLKTVLTELVDCVKKHNECVRNKKVVPIELIIKQEVLTELLEAHGWFVMLWADNSVDDGDDGFEMDTSIFGAIEITNNEDWEGLDCEAQTEVNKSDYFKRAGFEKENWQHFVYRFDKEHS